MSTSPTDSSRSVAPLWTEVSSAPSHPPISLIAETNPIALPKVLRRVGRRGADWGLPRSFVGYKPVSHDQLSIRGAAPKFILRSQQDPNDWYIVKAAEKWGAVETLTELLNNVLGTALGFRMAHAGVLRADGELRFASRNFQQPHETLIHGSLLYHRVFDDELNTVGKNPWDEQRTYDIELIREMLVQVCGDAADRLFRRLLHMLVFDALIGSMDRHMQNWGVLATVNEPRTYEFAPIFDSARALLWDCDESKLEKLMSDSQALRGYVNRSKPIMGCPRTGRRVNHFEFMRLLLDAYPDPMREALEQIEPLKVARAARNVRKFPFNPAFTLRRRVLIGKVLEMRAEELHQIAKGRRQA